jgi:hypothetical protein
VNELLVPVSLDPVFVAVIVKLPVLEIVTLCEANTPAVNAAVVPLPEESVPVEVMFTVPVNPVTVLLFASRAVTLIVNAFPAICVAIAPPPEPSTKKFAKTPGFTVTVGNVLVIALPPIVALTVFAVPDVVPVKVAVYDPLLLSVTDPMVPLDVPPPVKENTIANPPPVRRLPFASLAITVRSVVSPEAIDDLPTDTVD